VVEEFSEKIKYFKIKIIKKIIIQFCFERNVKIQSL